MVILIQTKYDDLQINGNIVTISNDLIRKVFKKRIEKKKDDVLSDVCMHWKSLNTVLNMEWDIF